MSSGFFLSLLLPLALVAALTVQTDQAVSDGARLCVDAFIFAQSVLSSVSSSPSEVARTASGFPPNTHAGILCAATATPNEVRALVAELAAAQNITADDRDNLALETLKTLGNSMLQSFEACKVRGKTGRSTTNEAQNVAEGREPDGRAAAGWMAARRRRNPGAAQEESEEEAPYVVRGVPSDAEVASLVHKASEDCPILLVGAWGYLSLPLAVGHPSAERDPYLAHNLGFLKVHFGDLEGAQAYFQRAIELNSPDPGPYIERGLWKRRLRDFAGALELGAASMERPGLQPSSRNEFAALTNALTTSMQATDPPSHLLRRILFNRPLLAAVRLLPHFAMFRAYVAWLTAEWTLDDDEGINVLMEASINAQTAMLAGKALAELARKRGSSLSSFDEAQLSPFVRSLLASSAATHGVSDAMGDWLRQAAAPELSLQALGERMVTGVSGRFLAESYANTAAFELAYVHPGQWALPHSIAMAGATAADVVAPPPPQRMWYHGKEGRIDRSSDRTGRGTSSSSRRLRLAYLSPDFRRHAIGLMMAGPLAAHDRAKVSVACYHTKEVGNMYGRAGLLGKPFLIRPPLNRTSVETRFASVERWSRALQSVQFASSPSPDWAQGGEVELGMETGTVDRFVDWSAWARSHAPLTKALLRARELQEVVEARRREEQDEDERGGDSEAEGKRGDPARISLASVLPSSFCDANLWTHTSRIATMCDSFHATLMWPSTSRTSTDIARHMSETARPHIVVDLAGPTLGGTTDVVRLRPSVLTVHYLSGPISVGIAGSADYAIVDTKVLPPENAFHAPNDLFSAVMFGRGRRGKGVEGVRAETAAGPGEVSPFLPSSRLTSPFPTTDRDVAEAIASMSPSTIRAKHPTNSSGASSSTLVVRSFTESLVYVRPPFQSNTFPTTRAAIGEGIQPEGDGEGGWEDGEEIVLNETMPSPCAALLTPLLRTPRGGSGSGDDWHGTRRHPSARLCPDRSRIVLGALHAGVKISPTVFTAWMDILRHVPRAELWLLLQSNRGPHYAHKLWAQAEARGIHRSRVVFVAEAPRERFWHAFPCIDVFLDAWMYGAHSTGADALRFGVPVVTLAGPTFASRVVSSLIAASSSSSSSSSSSAARAGEKRGKYLERLLVSHTAAEYISTVLRLVRPVGVGEGDRDDEQGGGGGNSRALPLGRFGRPAVPRTAPLARHLKIILQPLVGGTLGAASEGADVPADNDGAPAPPPPFDYISQAATLERAYRCMWEARSIAGNGFSQETLTVDGANALKLPHVVVDPGRMDGGRGREGNLNLTGD